MAFSLIFSFAGMRIVGGLPHAIQAPRRYWIHLSFVCIQLLATVMVFWLFWSFRTVDWNLPKFVLVLASPGLIYFNACTLIPENPSAVESWRDYYYSVRRRYFFAVCCWILAVAIISTVVIELPLLHPARIAQVALLVAGATGVVSPHERVHAGLVLFFILFFLVLASTLAFRPGPFAPPQ